MRAVPLAVLLELDALTLVVLVLVRDVVAPFADGALERHVNSLVVGHGASLCGEKETDQEHAGSERVRASEPSASRRLAARDRTL